MNVKIMIEKPEKDVRTVASLVKHLNYVWNKDNSNLSPCFLETCDGFQLAKCFDNNEMSRMIALLIIACTTPNNYVAFPTDNPIRFVIDKVEEVPNWAWKLDEYNSITII